MPRKNKPKATIPAAIGKKKKRISETANHGSVSSVPSGPHLDEIDDDEPDIDVPSQDAFLKPDDEKMISLVEALKRMSPEVAQLDEEDRAIYLESVEKLKQKKECMDALQSVLAKQRPGAVLKSLTFSTARKEHLAGLGVTRGKTFPVTAFIKKVLQGFEHQRQKVGGMHFDDLVVGEFLDKAKAELKEDLKDWMAQGEYGARVLIDSVLKSICRIIRQTAESEKLAESPPKKGVAHIYVTLIPELGIASYATGPLIVDSPDGLLASAVTGRIDYGVVVLETEALAGAVSRARAEGYLYHLRDLPQRDASTLTQRANTTLSAIRLTVVEAKSFDWNEKTIQENLPQTVIETLAAHKRLYAPGSAMSNRAIPFILCNPGIWILGSLQQEGEQWVFHTSDAIPLSLDKIENADQFDREFQNLVRCLLYWICCTPDEVADLMAQLAEPML